MDTRGGTAGPLPRPPLTESQLRTIEANRTAALARRVQGPVVATVPPAGATGAPSVMVARPKARPRSLADGDGDETRGREEPDPDAALRARAGAGDSGGRQADDQSQNALQRMPQAGQLVVAGGQDAYSAMQRIGTEAGLQQVVSEILCHCHATFGSPQPTTVVITCVHAQQGGTTGCVNCTTMGGSTIGSFAVPEQCDPYGPWLLEEVPRVLRAAHTIEVRLVDSTGSTIHAREAPGQLECGICIATMTAQEVVTVLPCFHAFHGECLARWMATGVARRYCPMCRLDFQRAVELTRELRQDMA